MRFEKRPIIPGRIRRIPENFSWIDRRFVRERVIARLTRDETLLYFFLVAVADKDGLSFYAEATIGSLLGMAWAELEAARRGLVAHDLVAHRASSPASTTITGRSAASSPSSTATARPRSSARP